MQLGITSKLFIVVLLTNVITAVAVGLGVRAAFDAGFDRYVKEREEQRLTRLAEVMANAYREAGSWDFLRGNDEAWVQLNHAVRPAMRGFPQGPRPGEAAPQARRVPMRPPPGLVLDARGEIVAGDADPRQGLDRKPITVSGERVGWIASPVRHNAFDLVDRRLQERVWQSSAIVALGAIGLAAIVAWFLARGLLAPVRRLAGATRKLADGEYATRVESSSRDELGRLVEDFNRLGNALEKNESARRAFMADVSHELRTPIAVLKGELEAIEDGMRPCTPETIRSLQAEVARLGKLVNDIHDLSLADAGGLAYRFEAVDLGSLVRDTLERAVGRIEARHLAVDASAADPVAVRGDALRLAQLLGNLLENSLRYTDQGGSLRISVQRQGNRALLAWEDSKPGVPPEALPRLFDRLYRVEASRCREGGGSGLGLSIAKSIAEAHGGCISAAPSALGGLRVEVLLPLASAP